jgi:hypothetical protein
MQLQIPVKILRQLGEGDDVNYHHYTDYYSKWSSDTETKDFQVSALSDEELDLIEKLAKDYPEASPLVKRISSYKTLLKTGETKELRRLLDVPASFIAFAKKNLPNKLIYVQDEMGNANPYMAIECEYVNPRRDDDPPYVYFDFRATKQGRERSKSFSIYTADLKSGPTIAEILANNNIIIETPELNEEHAKNLEYYQDLMTKTGSVYVGTGNGTAIVPYIDRWGESTTRTQNFYFRDNSSPKVVIDFDGVYADSTDKEKNQDGKRIMSRIEGTYVTLPIHTYGDVFHLEEHVWITIHVNNLRPYQFKGKELMQKLVLSTQDKELIAILMQMSKMKINDIIEGKSGGSFIIATGNPGTGKTLTAEVFSETIEKPLYKVQCSQLGLDVETVEKNLKAVLSRAGRWGAILLIDEADVYVRARGTDIHQNAIVGTFLRTLEYYTGILFMTSNMETAIDDAIMSRATAHLQYSIPSDMERKQIWEILSRQFEIEFNMDELDELTTYFDNIVGRDIKALLKLGKMLAEGRREKITPDLIKSIAGFVPNVNRSKKLISNVEESQLG